VCSGCGVELGEGKNGLIKYGVPRHIDTARCNV
jgi:hypothetical protein